MTEGLHKAAGGYKASRAQEIAGMMEEYGLADHKELLIAHLLRECGSMTEFCDWTKGKQSNDGGWAFGIAQWHFCYREWDFLYSHGWAYYDSAGRKQCHWNTPITTIRDTYFKERPDMKDWRQQAHRYLREIKALVDQGKTATAAVDSWNSNPAYMSHVIAKKPLARSLLSL